ncbi:hypothetical protein JD276_04210 [Leucobacter sp. CSA1]|uniref:Uncharacterized protein n=1 Tax=Leucobacter chromiisoli TaxID=2796471 RepID=A0A934UUI6_9MICO|nr:hypothetical protein [Leucobacter chromiisoli]MBK0418233.1 hypothetical protein [Leucobacter chromiisoli]
MANQPALRTSSGNVWVIVGFLFAAASMIPLSALIFVSPGRSAPVAWATAVAVVVFFAALLLTRFLARPGAGRLRRLAVYFLTMAAVALIGILVSAFLEATP